ncbi:cytochrome C [Stakelama marina]|uniref:Cytochrome C n=1 Tax=Stakelama marina TaxID=2826939 RepID=A0A8T4IFH2_9SPHN|nr:cytochrome C [Stakelama marina]MBR0550999.1 cytochrome C [Stakelama marina]
MTRRTILLVLVAVIIFWAAGLITRSVLEQAVSPGPLSAAHAKLGADCLACHVPFAHSLQNKTCTSCHKQVGRDIRNGTGHHGRIPDIKNRTCASCHDEHKGRKADILGLSPQSFDHSMTDFALHGAHRRVKCSACHKQGEHFFAAPNTCIGCHKKDDVHKGKFGTKCAACHTATDWKLVHDFDHSVTGYPLVGKHKAVPCASCHVGNRFAGTPRDCVSCHRKDDVHNGARGTQCQTCHSPAGWKLATFDHDRDTRFALTGAHAAVGCTQCHGQAMSRPKPPMTCIGCHRSDDVHRGRNGTDCAGCHVTRSWKVIHFDHSKTRFPLRGAHRKVRCQACHVGPLHKFKPPLTCVGCHGGDDPHGGKLGRDCATCHTAASWKKGLRFDHSLTRFPLLGAHARLQCSSCHVDQRFTAKGITCASCHEDTFHRGRLGKSPDCATCHNSENWKDWHFDHGAQTGFVLDGSHKNLECHACHTKPAATAQLGSTCYSCHRADDVHHGEFGQRCGDCHTTRAFKPAHLPDRVGAAPRPRNLLATACPADRFHAALAICGRARTSKGVTQ